MANDRLWLRHKPSGRAILLMKWWGDDSPTAFHTRECMERWFAEVLGGMAEWDLPPDLFDVVTENSGAKLKADWTCDCGKERKP